MRPFPCLILLFMLVGCGAPNPVSDVAAAPVIAATISNDDGITGDDIGATVVASTITIPSCHELQVAVLVFRDGTFSPADSFIACTLNNREQKDACRMIAFAAHGPLRPDATDALVTVKGHQIHFPQAEYPGWGHNGPPVLMPGQPYQCIGQLIYDQQGAKRIVDDIRHPEGVADAVYLYARIVALSADDPRGKDLRSAQGQYGIGRDLPIATLDDVLGPAPTTGAKAPAGF